MNSLPKMEDKMITRSLQLTCKATELIIQAQVDAELSQHRPDREEAIARVLNEMSVFIKEQGEVVNPDPVILNPEVCIGVLLTTSVVSLFLPVHASISVLVLLAGGIYATAVVTHLLSKPSSQDVTLALEMTSYREFLIRLTELMNQDDLPAILAHCKNFSLLCIQK